LSWQKNVVIEYPREFKPIFETASACEPGDPGVLFAEKKSVENLGTLAFQDIASDVPKTTKAGRVTQSSLYCSLFKMDFFIYCAKKG
jgi:hypothetical protein